MTTKLDPVVFAPAIMSHQASITRRDFNEAFYYGLLLNPAQAIADTAFFLTPAIEHHFEFGDQSWLRAAVECGAIVPIFRSEKSFEAVLQRLIEDKFAGLPVQHRPKHKEQLERLRGRAKSLDERRARWIPFPSEDKYRLGDRLFSTVKRKFLGKTPPIDPRHIPLPLLRDADWFWKETRVWRNWVNVTVANREAGKWGQAPLFSVIS